MNQKLALVILVGLLVTACARQDSVESPPPAVADADASSYDDVFAAAEKTLTAAQDRRIIWSKTEALLADSKAAHADGRVAEAIELATEARLQAELALAQADFEQDAWRTRILTD